MNSQKRSKTGYFSLQPSGFQIDKLDNETSKAEGRQSDSNLFNCENFNIFENLSENSLINLKKIVTLVEIKKDQPIYLAHDHSSSIFFLRKGRVKLTRASNDGKEMILSLVNPGEVFGELSIVEDGYRQDYAIALADCFVCVINKLDFIHFIEEHPNLNIKVMKLFSKKLKKYSERIEDLVFKNAQQRIISFLLNFSKDYGKRLGDKLYVRPFFTQPEIAKLTDCSRQTVNLTLTKFREKGIIYFDRKKLIIFNDLELAKIIKAYEN